MKRLLLVMALLGVPCFATITPSAVAANWSGSAGATSIATPAQSHAAGILIVCGLSVQVGDTPSFSNTAGDTWHLAGTAQAQGANQEWVAYAYNSNGNASDIVTASWISGSGAYIYLACYGMTSNNGSFTSDPLDDNKGGTGNSSSAASASLTVTAAHDVIVAVSEADGKTFVAGTGYTLVDDTGAGGGGFAASEYHIVTASEAATATVGSNAWGIKAAAFKEPTGALPSPTISYTFPFSSNTSGGEPVQIFGANFRAGVTVTFNSVAASRVWVSADGTTISAVVPASVATGWVAVTVTNSDTTSGTKASGFNYQSASGCGVSCGNVGYSYSGPAQTSLPATCNTTLAAGNYLLAGDVTAATPATTCFALSFPSGDVTIDLGGHTVSGVIDLHSTNHVGQVTNGTVNCQDNTCVTVTAGETHHLTIAVTSAAPASCSTSNNAIILANTETSSTGFLLNLVHNLTTSVGRCDLATRSRNIEDSAGSTSGGTTRSLSIEAYNNDLTCATSSAVCQGFELFAGAGEFVHNNNFHLAASPTGDSNRAVIFDQTFPAEFAFNTVNVLGNRAVRVRAYNPNVFNANNVPFLISIHDNSLNNIQQGGNFAAIHVGENDSSLSIIGVDVFRNAFQFDTSGNGVLVSSATNVGVHNNTATCVPASCVGIGSFVKTAVQFTNVQTGTAVSAINNNVAPITAGGIAAVSICGNVGECVGNGTSVGTVVNSGTTTGSGQTITKAGSAVPSKTTPSAGTSIQ